MANSELQRAVEIIRQSDAYMLEKRKKKLFSVEIDPETYMAKEILYIRDLVKSLQDETRRLNIQIEKLRIDVSTNQDKESK